MEENCLGCRGGGRPSVSCGASLTPKNSRVELDRLIEQIHVSCERIVCRNELIFPEFAFPQGTPGAGVTWYGAHEAVARFAR